MLPEGDARIAYGAMNVGSNWLEAGRADLAEPRLREALEIRRAAYVAEPEHPELRTAAGWLISCLLVRAAAGEEAEANEAEARRLCDEVRPRLGRDAGHGAAVSLPRPRLTALSRSAR